MSEKRKYDSTVARIAGNILSGQAPLPRRIAPTDARLTEAEKWRVQWAVEVARYIVAKVELTEPAGEPTR